MAKTFFIIGFLSLAVTVNAFANDSDRIDQLEREIQDTKLRLLKLESLLPNPGNAQVSSVAGDGWKSIANWRKLTKNMSAADVQKILGEPQRVNGGTFTTWYYQNGGRVNFYEEKVDQWAEPR